MVLGAAQELAILEKIQVNREPVLVRALRVAVANLDAKRAMHAGVAVRVADRHAVPHLEGFVN